MLKSFIKMLIEVLQTFLDSLEKETPEAIPAVVVNHDYKTPDYKGLWASCVASELRKAEIDSICKKILLRKNLYELAEKSTGAPWWVIAVIHYREASLNFNSVLHNGEKIIGSGKKTKLVPAGRGPFNTWTEAAIDAIRLQKANFPSDWDVPRALEFLERYNGLGYRNKGVYSPYIWAGTNHYTKGKYVADGKYDANFFDKQLGCAALIKSLIS